MGKYDRSLNKTGYGVLFLLLAAGLIALAGCKKADQKLQQDPEGNFVLSVSNQSLTTSTVDIVIRIDGKLAVSSDFEVKDQHNYVKHSFSLSPGPHTLVAESVKGAARIEKKFEITKDPLWGGVSFSGETDGGGKGLFSFEVKDQPEIEL